MTIPVAVLGATGYAGEVSLRILFGHPGFRIVHAGSDRLAGTPLAEAVPAFAGETDLILRDDLPATIAASGAKAAEPEASTQKTVTIPARSAKRRMRRSDLRTITPSFGA